MCDAVPFLGVYWPVGWCGYVLTGWLILFARLFNLTWM